MKKNVCMAIAGIFTLGIGVYAVFVLGSSNVIARYPSPDKYVLKRYDIAQGTAHGGLAVSSTITSTLRIPLVVRDWCSHAIDFSFVPPYGGFDDLQGQVRCVDPADYKVAVYIFVGGWWTKPYWGSPLTPIQDDGTWICDITTGGNDQFATQIATFLLPNGYNPPNLSGEQALPTELFERSFAHLIIDRSPVLSTITFSGLTWSVKKSDIPAGPGPGD
jgi:hypothetical protein